MDDVISSILCIPTASTNVRIVFATTLGWSSLRDSLKSWSGSAWKRWSVSSSQLHPRRFRHARKNTVSSQKLHYLLPSTAVINTF